MNGEMTNPASNDPTTEERLQIMDARLENMTAITQRIAEQQEINTQQIGLLTERIDAIGIRIDAIGEKIDALRDVVNNGFTELRMITQQQADTARLQAESVSRLIALLENR
jgi:hypothetical protein